MGKLILWGPWAIYSVSMHRPALFYGSIFYSGSLLVKLGRETTTAEKTWRTSHYRTFPAGNKNNQSR
jgi:hypothetical protein